MNDSAAGQTIACKQAPTLLLPYQPFGQRTLLLQHRLEPSPIFLAAKIPRPSLALPAQCRSGGIQKHIKKQGEPVVFSAHVPVEESPLPFQFAITRVHLSRGLRLESRNRFP